jgi:hypothetical protein
VMDIATNGFPDDGPEAHGLGAGRVRGGGGGVEAGGGVGQANTSRGPR